MQSELKSSHKALTINFNCMKCYMTIFLRKKAIYKYYYRLLYSCKRWVRKRACVPETSNNDM